MNSRPFKELSKQLTSMIDEISKLHTPKPKTQEEFDSAIHNLLTALRNYLGHHKGDLEDIVQEKDNSNGNGWVRKLVDIRINYAKIYKLNQKLMDKEKAIHRVERKAHTRALIFRFLTTLLIGFGVMIVYLTAQKLGINMPLLKVFA